MTDYRASLDLTPYPRPQQLTEEECGKACETLLRFLMRERGMIAAYSVSPRTRRTLLRARMNERPPLPVPDELLALQDGLLWSETLARGIVSARDLPEQGGGISLWQGDITRLDADAIVNAANSTLLGCMRAGHACIDNAIHSAAGMQLRADCCKIIACIGHEEECGGAKITRAYNLPSRYVIHTVGPVVGRRTEESDRRNLRSCYLSCLDLAQEMHLSTIVFCCISTGVFNFPADEAAEIATGAVLGWKLKHRESRLKVVFNTYLPRDTAIYANILGMIGPEPFGASDS